MGVQYGRHVDGHNAEGAIIYSPMYFARYSLFLKVSLSMDQEFKCNLAVYAIVDLCADLFTQFDNLIVVTKKTYM